MTANSIACTMPMSTTGEIRCEIGSPAGGGARGLGSRVLARRRAAATADAAALCVPSAWTAGFSLPLIMVNRNAPQLSGQTPTRLGSLRCTDNSSQKSKFKVNIGSGAPLERLSGLVMAGHSRSKNGVASLAYVPAIHVFLAVLLSRGCPAQVFSPGTPPTGV